MSKVPLDCRRNEKIYTLRQYGVNMEGDIGIPVRCDGTVSPFRFKNGNTAPFHCGF